MLSSTATANPVASRNASGVTPGCRLSTSSRPSRRTKTPSGVTTRSTLPAAVTKSSRSTNVRGSCRVRHRITRRAVGISMALPAPPGNRTVRLLPIADGAQVDAPLAVDLDAAQKRDVEPAPGRKVEEIGQRHEGARARQQRGIDRRDRQARRLGIDGAGDVQVGQIRRMQPLGQQRRDHRQGRGHAMEDRLAGTEQPRHGDRHHVPRGDARAVIDHADRRCRRRGRARR